MVQRDDTKPRTDDSQSNGQGGAATAERQDQPPSGTEEEALELSAAELTKRFEEAEAKAKECWDQMLRARADLENERRRFSRELQNTHKYAIEKFVLELLPVKDSLELGLGAAADAPNIEKLREGMELTLKMLQTALEKFGIGEINPLGERFDPERHESMASQETSSVEPNTVVTVYQKGYALHDRLLRPALVVISKPAAQNIPNIDERA
jgi:molecular chaperone GrpE